MAELLEDMSRRRQESLPSIAPAVAPPSAPPPMELGGDYEASGPNLASLLAVIGQRSGPGPQARGPGDPKNWEAVAQEIGADKYGYSNKEFNALDSIIERESHWDPHAYNESSGAAGIAQRISGWGPGYRENLPKTQINWLYNYIQDRYGTPFNALQHKNSTGWY